VLQIGMSEASVLMQKVASYGDPRLYALALVAEHLSRSQQPLVPQQMFVAGQPAEGANPLSSGQGLLGTLINLLVAEKSGFKFDGNGQSESMKQLAHKLTEQAMSAMQESGNVDLPAPPSASTPPVVAKAAPSFRS